MCGAWKLQELDSVLRAVQDLADKLGGTQAFRNIVGPLHMRRLASWRKDLSTRFGEVLFGGIAAARTWGEQRVVKLYDEAFSRGQAHARETVVHELAHIWDVQSPAHERLFAFVGREQGWKFDVLLTEHWAQAVILWVYHEEELGPLHSDYLRLAATGRFPDPLGPQNRK